MEVFIGGSSERKDLMSEVATWVENITQERVLRWDMEEAFPLGGSTWNSLIHIANSVHAAIFIMSADDQTWHRNALLTKPRDNVILEYGLFTGLLGTSRVIMCVDEDVAIASDLKGIIYASLAQGSTARRAIELWLKKIQTQGGFLTKKEKNSLTLKLLLLIKNKGIADPNVDYWISIHKHDGNATHQALQAGADKQKSEQYVINQYNAIMLDNTDYKNIVAQLRAKVYLP